MLKKCLLPLLLAAAAGVCPAQEPDAIVPTISQIAVGGTWRTTIVLMNTTTTEQSFRLRFRDSRGNPLLLTWQKVTATTADTPQFTVELTGSVPRFGLITYRSVASTTADTQVGYAQLVEGTGISGQAIFQQVQPNGSVYAAAAPLALPVQQFILPTDTTSGSITAIAVANPSRGENVLEVGARRDSGGFAMEEPSRRMEPWQHRAEPVTTFFSSTLGNKYGVADVVAKWSPVAALGLRFLANNGPFSSFEPVDKEQWSGGLRTRPSISQIVAGGPWTTTLILVNIQPIPANFRVEFRNSAGAPLALNWEKRTASTEVTSSNPNELAGMIPGGGMAVFVTVSEPATQVRQGYARLLEGTLVKGQAIFTQTTAGGVKYEAASPLKLGTSWFLLPFDNVGSETGLAIANTTPIQTVGTVRITNEDGALIGQTQIGFAPSEHKAGTVTALFPAFAQQMRGRRGTIEIVSLPSELHALGLRFEGEFFTSFPVVPLQ